MANEENTNQAADAAAPVITLQEALTPDPVPTPAVADPLADLASKSKEDLLKLKEDALASLPLIEAALTELEKKAIAEVQEVVEAVEAEEKTLIQKYGLNTVRAAQTLMLAIILARVLGLI